MNPRSDRMRLRGSRKLPFEIMVIGLFASLLLNLALPISAFGANESLVDLSAYEGHWQRIDEGDSDEARLSAIGTALESLSWLMRRMASPILRKTTAPPT